MNAFCVTWYHCLCCSGFFLNLLGRCLKLPFIRCPSYSTFQEILLRNDRGTKFLWGVTFELGFSSDYFARPFGHQIITADIIVIIIKNLSGNKKWFSQRRVGFDGRNQQKLLRSESKREPWTNFFAFIYGIPPTWFTTDESERIFWIKMV